MFFNQSDFAGTVPLIVIQKVTVSWQNSHINEPEGERVRKNTSFEKNKAIDNEILDHIGRYSGSSAEAISARIRQLDREWDMERVLETNMSLLALTGLTLGVFFSSYWLVLPAVVLLFFLQHALQGWCPPIPLFRAF